MVGDAFLGSSFLVLVFAPPQPPHVVVSSLSSFDGGGSSTSVMPENLLLPFLALLVILLGVADVEAQVGAIFVELKVKGAKVLVLLAVLGFVLVLVQRT